MQHVKQSISNKLTVKIKITEIKLWSTVY